MDSRIWRVLSRLEDQSNPERLMEKDIPPENMMLAITSDTICCIQKTIGWRSINMQITSETRLTLSL